MFWALQVDGEAVGFMSVCSRVNMQLLHECFDLRPFHGLCIPHPDDILDLPKEFSVGSQGTVASTESQGGHTAVWFVASQKLGTVCRGLTIGDFQII